MNFEKCKTLLANKKISVAENGRKLILHNPRTIQISVFKVDNCIITNSHERCDYLFEFRTSTKVAVFLELKGVDIGKANSQIVKTVGYMLARHKSHRKIGHIVASRVPKAGPKVQNLKLNAWKKHNLLLFVSTQTANADLAKSPYA
jgi:hypothetical protein